MILMVKLQYTVCCTHALSVQSSNSLAISASSSSRTGSSVSSSTSSSTSSKPLFGDPSESAVKLVSVPAPSPFKSVRASALVTSSIFWKSISSSPLPSKMIASSSLLPVTVVDEMFASPIHSVEMVSGWLTIFDSS